MCAHMITRAILDADRLPQPYLHLHTLLAVSLIPLWRAWATDIASWQPGRTCDWHIGRRPHTRGQLVVHKTLLPERRMCCPMERETDVPGYTNPKP